MLQLSVYFHKHKVHWNYGKSSQSINVVAIAATLFFPFNQTRTEARPSEID